MRLFLILTGAGDENYILASSLDDAKKYFKGKHIMDCRELDVRMSVSALNWMKD